MPVPAPIQTFPSLTNLFRPRNEPPAAVQANAAQNALAALFGAGGEALVSNAFYVAKHNAQLAPQPLTWRQTLGTLTPQTMLRGSTLNFLATAQRRVLCYSMGYEIPKCLPQDHRLPKWAVAAAVGIPAGVIDAYVTSPWRVAMLLMQSRYHTHVAPNPVAAMRYIYRSEGMAGMWKGAHLTAGRNALASAVLLGSQAAMRSSDEANQGYTLVIGALSSALATCVRQPADVIKSIMQGKVGTPCTALSESKKLFAAEGLRGFTRGLGAALIRSTPSAAAGFWVMEMARSTMLSHRILV